jgi:short-subunit dehydrogenase
MHERPSLGQYRSAEAVIVTGHTGGIGQARARLIPEKSGAYNLWIHFSLVTS